uniref:Insulin-like domain-containing protein n=1 Tax=Strigamia maritima TaxID=126957 RepID=T1JF91_STRMM
MSSHLRTAAAVLILLSVVLSIAAQESAYFQELFTPHEIKIRAKQKYCGRNLVEVLQLVCARNVLNNLEAEEISDLLGNDFARSLMGIKHKIQTRGITDECCRKGCSFNELKSYCAEEP